jgi:nucleotide-binding universal stress UspA family protein
MRGSMNGFDNQLSVRVEAIPMATSLSPSTDTIALYLQGLSDHFRPEALMLHVDDLGSAFGEPEASLPVNLYRVFEEKRHQDLTGDWEGKPPRLKVYQPDEDRSLLVIGTRGPGDLSRMVLGSTAQEFIYRAGIPVFTVGPSVQLPKRPIRFESIVYATDYSPEAAKACVSVFSFAREFAAQVYVCHVLPDPEGDCDLDEEGLNDRFVGALQALVSDVSPEWADPDCVLDYKYGASGILLVAQQVNASLIILGTRRAQRRFDDSTTGLAFQVISGSPCPVLSIQR